MRRLGMFLVIIGNCLVVLDWILGATGRTRTAGPRLGLLHVGVFLIGLGVLLDAEPLT